jgi:hypothetical protein
MLSELDKSSAKLVKDYQKAYEYILQRLTYQIDNSLSETHSLLLLREIQLELKRLDEIAYKWSNEVLPEFYLLALATIDNDVVLLKNVGLIGSMSQPHKFSIAEASRTLYTDLAKNTTFMSEQAKKVIRDNSAELITRQAISGESQKRTKKELKDALISDGVPSFIDAGNKHWKIGEYASMAVRTKSRIIHNQGTMNRLLEYREKYPTNQNFGLIQISTHKSKCWCGYFEGTVWSISEGHPKYPHVSALPNQPYKSFHPNCKHVYLPYMPELRGDGLVIPSEYLNRTIKHLNKEWYHSQK